MTTPAGVGRLVLLMVCFVVSLAALNYFALPPLPNGNEPADAAYRRQAGEETPPSLDNDAYWDEQDKSMQRHVVFSAVSSEYMEWQSLVFYHNYRMSGQPGALTRCLSGQKLDHISKVVPSFVATGQYQVPGDNYLGINQPSAFHEWIKTIPEKPAKQIIILDPDNILLHPINVKVHPGKAVGQVAYMYHNTPESMWGLGSKLADRYCHNCRWVDPVGIPLILHSDDARRVFPLWVNKTQVMRADKANWDPVWLRSDTLAFDWTTIMYSYIYACAELGIKHENRFDLQRIPEAQTLISGAPTVHYAGKFSYPNDDGNGKWEWHKHSGVTVGRWGFDGKRIPPPPKAAPEAVKVTIARINEAISVYPDYLPTRRDWSKRGYYGVVDDPQLKPEHH